MSWTFDRVAGPCDGITGGLAWDGRTMLFSAVTDGGPLRFEGKIFRFDPLTGSVSEFRRYTGRTNGIAIGPKGSVFGAQEGGRRVIEFRADGSTVSLSDELDGQYHNQPTDVAVDGKGRVWFADAYNTVAPYGSHIFPFLEHASVQRLERDAKDAWTLKRITMDTIGVRALALSPDEKTLYVAEGDPDRSGPRELRAYALNEGEVTGSVKVLHRFPDGERGIEGICVDSEGCVIACGGSSKSRDGAALYVFSASGELVETHPAPVDLPMRCAFGDADRGSLYLTTGSGELYRARDTGRKGVPGEWVLAR